MDRKNTDPLYNNIKYKINDNINYIKYVQEVFGEILYDMQFGKTELLKRYPKIWVLTDELVKIVEHSRDPKNWPIVEYTDDFALYHPEDHYYWTWLFFYAVFQSTDLADVLCILRGNGCKLVADDAYGYRIEPIIGGHGWKSLQQYNGAKEPLNNYIQLLLPLLKQLRAAADNDDVIPKRTGLQQTDLSDFAKG